MFSGAGTTGRLEDCDVLHTERVGVGISQSADPLLLRNRIRGREGCAVEITGGGGGRLEGNHLSCHSGSGVEVKKGSHAALTGNTVLDCYCNHPLYVDATSTVNASAATANVLPYSGAGGPGWKALRFQGEDEAQRPAVALWWAAQQAERLGSPKGRVGYVFPPGAFDVTVAPGEDVQAAINRCPAGGSVMLLPGTHKGPVELAADKEVHVFGRGQAVLLRANGTTLTSFATKATIDGLLIRCQGNGNAVSIRGGGLRLQASDLACTGWQVPIVFVAGGATSDATIIGCRRA